MGQKDPRTHSRSCRGTCRSGWSYMQPWWPPTCQSGQRNVCKSSFFLQQRSHLQAKKLGEDGVGECHLIWMQASLNQKNSCKGGTKWSGLFFAANLEAHPIKKAKIWSGKWNEREMCREATWQNPKLNKCVDLRALMDSWWDWNSRMAARLNLWTSTFKVMDWFMKPGKYPNWKTKSAMISTHDVLWMDLCDPTTHADWEKNSQIAPAALELSRMGPAAKNAGSGLVTNGCHISWG